MQQAVTRYPSLLATRKALEKAAASLWKWWLDELAGVLPQAVLSYLKRTQVERSWLLVSRDVASVGFVIDGRTTVWLADGKSSPPLHFVNSLNDGLLPVRLHQELIFETTVDLPSAAEANLDKILGHHVGLLVPLEPEEVVFRYYLSGRDLSRGTITVLLAIVKKETIDSVFHVCRLFGVKPSSISAERQARASSEFNFLPQKANSRLRRPRGALIALSVINAALLSMLIASVEWSQLHRQEMVNREIARLSNSPSRLAVLKTTLSELREQSRYINGRVHRISRLDLIDELARQLPDTSYLSELRITDEDINLSGNADRATNLISSLEASGRFGNPHFVAPIYRWSDGSEHFEIAMHVSEPP